MQHLKILFLLLLPAIISGQTFNKLFDENDHWQDFGAALELDNNTILLSGSNRGSSWKDFFIWNVTLDQNGDTLFTRKITSGDSAIYNIGRNALVKNGPDLFLAGTYEHDDNNVRDAYLMKLDQNGGRIWEKRYGGDRSDILDCMQRTQDGNLVMAGASHSFEDQAKGNAYIVKTDMSGAMLWQKTFGQNNFPEHFFAVDTTADGGYILAGVQGFDGTEDIFVIKTNSTGDQQWKWVYGFPQADDNTFPRIRTLKNGNYLLTTALRPNSDLREAYLACISPSGAKLWEKFYPGTEWHSDFGFSTELPNGDLVVSGTVMEFDTVFTSNYWVRGTLTKTDAQGNLIWQRKYYTTPNHDNYFFGMIPVSDAGFLMYGLELNGDDLNQDAWAVKVDSFGCLEPGCQTVPAQGPGGAEVISFSISPNPASSFAQIESPEAVLLGLRLSDLQGRVLEDVQFRRTDQVRDFRLSLGAQPAGLYLLSLRTEKGWVTRQLVKGER